MKNKRYTQTLHPFPVSFCITIISNYYWQYKSISTVISQCYQLAPQTLENGYPCTGKWAEN